MLTYSFMQNAFAASGIVAVVAGVVGFFLVLRGQTFAGHALSHVGFAGATGAVLIGIPPLAGMIVFTVATGLAMGALGERIKARDIAVGILLSLSLGLGLLFLHFYTAYATQVTALLFGNLPAAAVREPPARTGRGEGRLALLHLTAVSCHRRADGCRMRPDRRHPAGLYLDGRAGRRSGAPDHPPWRRCGAGSLAGAGPSLDRHCARLLYRLANQLLDYGLECRGLFRQPAALKIQSV